MEQAFDIEFPDSALALTTFESVGSLATVVETLVREQPGPPPDDWQPSEVYHSDLLVDVVANGGALRQSGQRVGDAPPWCPSAARMALFDKVEALAGVDLNVDPARPLDTSAQTAATREGIWSPH